jgi:hypothetical protein
MRNFRKLGFKNHLDAYENPSIWNAKKLIVQLDSLLNVLMKSDAVANDERFDLQYDFIVLDESESLLAHFDEGTMETKDIRTFDFFDQLLQHCKKVVMLDGDVSRRSLEFAKHYGACTYVKNQNQGSKRTFHLVLDEQQWKSQLATDLQQFYQEDPNFKVCIASQSSSRAVALEKELQEKHPQLVVKCLVGTDSGETKRQFMEDVNEALQHVNVFIYSPVIESGVDITIPVKKVYGILCNKSNGPRAYCQMLARCRNVAVARIDVLGDPMLKVNQNHNFWTFQEVMELNRTNVETSPMDFIVREGYLEIDNERHVRRKTVSIYNTVERLNKHPSLFMNYLKKLCVAKGMDWEVQEKPADANAKQKKTKTKNYKVAAIMEAADLTHEQFEELSELKKAGKTTTEQNYQIDKHFYKAFFLTKTLDEDVLKAFVFDRHLYTNFLALVDPQNHVVEDNLRSSKLLEQVQVVRVLLDGLGFSSALDDKVVDRESFMTNFQCNTCDEPLLKNKKRINELFDLSKGCWISTAMNSKQVLNWSNALLKPFSLKLVASERDGYCIEPQNGILEIARRKWKNGQKFKDTKGLLQLVEEDPFTDDEPPAVVVASTNSTVVKPSKQRRRRREPASYDTSRLDEGITCDSD